MIFSANVNFSTRKHRRCFSMFQFLGIQATCSPDQSKMLSQGRADTKDLRSVFVKYASITDKDGQQFMTREDFICRYLGFIDAKDANLASVDLYGNAADITKDGLISFAEFQAFEALLCKPDSLNALVFQLFDTNGSGTITYDEFHHFLSNTIVHQHIPFDFESQFVQLHFGCDKKRQVSYAEFTQLLHDFHEEYAVQAFKTMDSENRGYITALQFSDIMSSIKGHLLTSGVRENLVALSGSGTGHHVTFPFFKAVTSLLNNLELIQLIFNTSVKNNRRSELTKEEFLHECKKYAQITPLEVDILFQLVDCQHQNGRITKSDIISMVPSMSHKLPSKVAVESKSKTVGERSVLMAAAESVYRFGLGAIAGAVGATFVYPIDLVKTRMQNQRSPGSYVGELMYKNSFDCAKKVIRHEGVLGLYRGLPPQLVGVAPEKAIKLTMNDLVRDTLTDRDGNLPLWGEIVAGGCAGGSQVLFTNPLEIVKIRLQVAGEVVSHERISAISVIKELGILGLYKGARACLLRDIPFSAIYFTAYAHAKLFMADENGYNSPLSLLLSATMAGAPAASLTTPADVIKTRLQVKAREAQTTYTGVIDCARKIMREEGPRAFWKGAPARVFRSSPQFGVTLLTYELLQRTFNVDFGGIKRAGSEKRSTSVESSLNQDHIGGYRLALSAFEGIESKFGLCLPKFKTT